MLKKAFPPISHLLSSHSLQQSRITFFQSLRCRSAFVPIIYPSWKHPLHTIIKPKKGFGIPGELYLSMKPPDKNPFLRHTSMHYSGELDLEKMNRAAELLLKTEDFTSFCKLHSDNKTNICNVTHARWVLREDNMLVFTIEANRFLRNMVRAVVGTLIEVGRGKLSIEQFQKIIDTKDRCAASASAQPQGLFLSGVEYPY